MPGHLGNWSSRRSGVYEEHSNALIGTRGGDWLRSAARTRSRSGSAVIRRSHSREARGPGHRLHDVPVELLAEVRGDLRRRHIDLDLVEVLQSQDIVVGEIGNDPGKEKPESLERGTHLPGFRLRQR